ncbi:hypothetical protein D3C80_1947050 [compost metagenome]
MPHNFLVQSHRAAEQCLDVLSSELISLVLSEFSSETAWSDEVVFCLIVVVHVVHFESLASIGPCLD